MRLWRFGFRMVLATLLAPLTGLSGQPVYLPTVGAPPLRFALPAPPPSTGTVPLAALEPIRPTAPSTGLGQAPAAATPEPTAPTGPSPSTEAPNPLIPPAANAPDSFQPPTFTLPIPVEPEAPLPPLWSGDPAGEFDAPNLRMLLRFFVPQSGTNQNPIAVLTPVPFIPPQPPAPSSSAAFETVPPGKP